MSRHTEFAKTLPWVTHLAWSEPCDGLKWAQMPLKAIYQWGPRDNPNPPVGVDKWRCKSRAYWEFEALPPRDEWDMVATSGIYCWQHLLSQIYDYHRERERLARYWRQHG